MESKALLEALKEAIKSGYKLKGYYRDAEKPTPKRIIKLKKL